MQFIAQISKCVENDALLTGGPRENVVNFVDDQNLKANSLEQPNHDELHVDGSGAQTRVDAQRVQNLGEQLAFTGPPRQLNRKTCCRSMPLRGSKSGG